MNREIYEKSQDTMNHEIYEKSQDIMIQKYPKKKNRIFFIIICVSLFFILAKVLI